MQFGPEWAIWPWLVIVMVAIVAAVLVRLSPRPMLSALRPHHVAAAAIVGVLAWGALLQLPNIVQTVLMTYAGIDDAPNQGLHQAFAAGQAATVVAGAFAVVGLTTRRAWAVPLAVGVCAASLGTSIMGFINWIGLLGDYGGAPGTEWLIVQFALQPAPAIVGLVLLAWPFFDGSVRPAPADVPHHTRPHDDDGIVDAESEEAVDVEWPEWGRAARGRG